MDEAGLLQKAAEVLKSNDQGDWTVPARDIYPHQWLWDSCFIAIGLRHLDAERAKIELLSLKRGQWSNGMMPDMIFSSSKDLWLDRILWDSALSPYSPEHVATSGITQPPMLAEAVHAVGQKLKLVERRSWYKQMLPTTVRFHEWLYKERDPGGEGLVTLVHPYESGMDDSPPWISELRARGIPLWVKIVDKLKLGFFINFIRRDTRHVAAAQRMSTAEVLSLFVALRRMRRQGYNSKKILAKPFFAVQDLAFNSILVRSNSCLVEIAKTAGVKLPEKLQANMTKTETALESLWDEASGQYFCRSLRSGELIREASIATFLPLYSGVISQERAETLVKLLNKRGAYKAEWSLPSVPLDSTWFNPDRYWQGPTWISMNWLIIRGLQRYGFDKEAEALRQRTLDLVDKNGCAEYFNPQTGAPHGTRSFSWTAALTIDLLKN